MIYLTLNVPHTWFPLKLEELKIWMDTGKKLKLDVKVIDPISTLFDRPIPSGVFNFIGPTNSSHYRMLSDFKRKNVKFINDIDIAIKAEDKFYCLSELESQDIKVPKRLDINIIPGFAVNMKGELSNYIQHMIGFPCILKIPKSGQGEGHIFIKDKHEFNDMYSLICLTNPRFGFQDSGIDFFVEEFIKNNNEFARTTRVNMWDGECLNAISRGNLEYWKSNVHWKNNISTPYHVPLNKEIKKICNKIYKTFKLKLMGIDLFESDKGYIVGEINTSPSVWSSTIEMFGNTGFNAFETILKELQ